MKKGTIYIVSSYAIWGFLSAYWKVLSDMDSLSILGYRIVWSAVTGWGVLLAVGAWREAKALLRDRRLCLQLLLAGFLIALTWWIFIFAVNTGRALEGSLSSFMSPILTIFFGFLIFREKLSACQWGAVALAFVGVLIPIIWYHTVPLLAIIMAVAFAIYNVVKKKIAVSSYISTFMEALFVVPAAVAVLVTMEIRGSGAIGVITGWRWLLLPLAGVVTYLPLMLLSKGVQTTPMSTTGIIMYISPVIQFVLSIWVYGEELTPANLVTFICVVAAVLLFVVVDRLVKQRGDQKRASQPAVQAYPGTNANSAP